MKQPITTEIVEMTPQWASELLATNADNRTLNLTRVTELASAIQNEEFLFNGESVKIDQSGKLIDGQHRLSAVVAANSPLKMLLVKGLCSESAVTIDTGKKRSLSDVLHMHGVQYRVVVSAFLNLNRKLELIWADESKSISSFVPRLTNAQGLETYLEDSQRIDSACRIASITCSKFNRTNSAVTAALAYHTQDIHPEEFKIFNESLKTGIDLEKGSPVLALRNWLLANKMQKRIHITPALEFAVTTLAWDRFLIGIPTETQHLRIWIDGPRQSKLVRPS